MKVGDERGFSLVEVLVSLVIVCIVIEIVFTSFIYVKKQYVKEAYKQEAVMYGQEMIQYVREKMSLEGKVQVEDLRDYLRDRPEKMSDYTYSFIWIPFSYNAHKVAPIEIESALKCSTEPTFNWESVQDTIARDRLYLKTFKQKGTEVGYERDSYWLIGIVGKKQGDRVYEEIQYFVTYQ